MSLSPSAPRPETAGTAELHAALACWRGRLVALRGTTLSFRDAGSLLLDLVKSAPLRLGAAARAACLRPIQGEDRQRDLLPLPLSPLPAEGTLDSHAQQWLLEKLTTRQLAARNDWAELIILILNYQYHGGAEAASLPRPACGPCTPAQAEASLHIVRAVELFVLYSPEEVVFEDWTNKLKETAVSYGGEEVSRAQRMTAAQVVPTLPDVGLAAAVPALDVATGAVRHFLERPDECILPEARWPASPRRATTWAPEEEYYDIVTALLERGIVRPIQKDKVFAPHGRPVLNGTFGVVKAGDDPVELPGGGSGPRLRLIMNFVPINEYQVPILGDVGDLPLTSQWHALCLLSREVLLWSGLDRKCFFYVWYLPDSWMKYMAFEKPVPPERVGLPAGAPSLVAARVPAMGWISAVGVCQHLARNLLLRASSRTKELPLDAELRRRRPVPLSGREDESASWEVYIDNLEQQEIVSAAEAVVLRGSRSELLDQATSLYDDRAVPGNDKKAVYREVDVTTLGERVHGGLGRRDPPRGYVAQLFGLSAFLLGESRWRRHDLQVLAGRWVRVMSLRRPALGVFDHIWKTIAGASVAFYLPAVAEEILVAMCLAPLLYADMRQAIDPQVTVSDASPYGAGACASSGLSRRGAARAAAVGRRPWHPAEEELVIVSAFDGIGGIFEAWDRIGVPSAGTVSLEIDREATRVSRDAWPRTIEWGDITKISDEQIAQLRNLFPRARRGLLSGGFPCQGMSALNPAARGLEDERTSLVFVLLELFARLQDILHDWEWDFLFENVDSEWASEIGKINELVGRVPYLICAGAVSRMRRPRLYWLSRPLAADWEGSCLERGHRREVQLAAPLEPDWRWLSAGASYPLAADPDARLPTAVRCIPRSRPPRAPAGIAQCDEEALARWKADDYAVAPYQYQEKYLVKDRSGILRRPNAEEREILMGYRKHHTRCALKSGAAKSDPRALEVTRQALLGNAYHVEVVAWLASHLAVAWGYRDSVVSFEEIRSRRDLGGAASGPSQLASRGFSDEQLLVLEQLRSVDSKGSDVRVDTGRLFDPSGWPRQPVDVGLWKWQVLFGYAFERTGHINELELRGMLSALKWRLRRAAQVGTKALHLLDSQVSIGVLCKKRSSARVLNRIIKRIDALELAGHIYLLFGFVRSEANPADRPSRWAEGL